MPEGEAAAAPDERRMRADIVVVLLAFLVAGLLVGALWPQLTEPVTVTRGELGLVTDEVGLARRFSNDAWFALLSGGAGLLLGVVLTRWRSSHEVVTVLTVTAGAMLAALVSARLGTWLGPDDPERVLEGARVGATARAQVRLASDAAYLVWPTGALAGAAVVLWSSARPTGDPAAQRRRQRFRDR